MNVEIMAVGTELLLGDIINTNAQFLAKELASLGVSVYRHTVVGDNEERIMLAFKEAFTRANIVITTGGLGPTKDDMTKEIAAKFFEKELVRHEESYRNIEQYFRNIGRELSDSNKKQADFPSDSIILKNNNGTAPGCIIEGNGKAIVLLPGPPKEMIPMFRESVIPYLKQFSDGVIASRVLRIYGIGEGHMAEKISDIIDSCTNPTVAPYAKETDVTLRITAKAKDEKEALKLIEPVVQRIRDRLGIDVYGEDETTMEEVVGEMLVNRKLTIATAESCTGGLLAGALINYAGISSVFMEGVITYSNEAKMKRLGVKRETLDKYGAVSEETAREMVEGLVERTNTNVGISVTGIAGPGGGTLEKPVGLVYIGLSINGRTYVKKCNLSGSREKIRQRTVNTALDWLRRELLSEGSK
jgi:nicotinamide-nucleotide amidase